MNDELKEIFSIGSTYVTQEHINPKEILGFGEWELTEGEVIVGIKESDNNFGEIGKKGGETTHSLTIEELAGHVHKLNNHTHPLSIETSEDGEHSHGGQTKNGALGAYEFNRPVGWDGQQRRTTTEKSGKHKHRISGNTNGSNNDTTKTGEGKAFNILQPYRVAGYLWIRIS